MILKQEIISVASTLNLLPTTVEKDYVLSWVLYGISVHPKLSEWLFKGGTCLKKCYFETYRFSEDLDFTAPIGSIYSEDQIKNAFNEVANVVYQETGINLRTQEIEVKESINKRNHKTYVAKFTYLGPLNLRSRTQQRIKFDITDDEIIADIPDIRKVFHPYSDAPKQFTQVKCYSINEILAEKTRALCERQGRGRDIYDIVNISRSFREHVDIKKAKFALKEKFKFKLLPEPSVDFIFSQIDLAQLKAAWEDQLKHQLQILPPVESFHAELRPALSWWIDEQPINTTLASISIPNKPDTTLSRIYFPESAIQQTKQIGMSRDSNLYSSKYLDQIRYAARNRLCVEVHYKDATRLAEPYALKQANTGNVLLYVHELVRNRFKTGQIKAYKINEISNVTVTQQVFSPRHIVEL